MEISTQLYLINEYDDGCYLGEVDIFNKMKRQSYCIANRNTHVMILSKSDLDGIVRDEFGHIYLELKKIADRRVESGMKKTKEIERLIRVFENPGEQNDRQSDVSNTSALLEEESQHYRKITVENLYDKAKQEFPIEQLINEHATDITDIPLEAAMKHPKAQIDKLAEQLEGRR